MFKKKLENRARTTHFIHAIFFQTHLSTEYVSISRDQKVQVALEYKKVTSKDSVQENIHSALKYSQTLLNFPKSAVAQPSYLNIIAYNFHNILQIENIPLENSTIFNVVTEF